MWCLHCACSKYNLLWSICGKGYSTTNERYTSGLEITIMSGGRAKQYFGSLMTGIWMDFSKENWNTVSNTYLGTSQDVEVLSSRGGAIIRACTVWPYSIKYRCPFIPHTRRIPSNLQCFLSEIEQVWFNKRTVSGFVATPTLFQVEASGRAKSP